MTTTTLNQLIYELLELRRANLKETDPVTIRLVVDWIQSQRARLIRQKLSRPITQIEDNLAQDLGANVTMTKVSSNDYSIDTGEYMWRTSIEIPHTIGRRDGKGTFLRVGPADKLTTEFDVVPYYRIPYVGNGKYNRDTVFAFVLGDYIYLHSKSGFHLTIDKINVKGVFQDPIAAALIADPTWTYDDNYPVNKSIVDELKLLIVKEKFPLTLLQAEDKTDDLEDNLENVVGQQEVSNK